MAGPMRGLPILHRDTKVDIIQGSIRDREGTHAPTTMHRKAGCKLQPPCAGVQSKQQLVIFVAVCEADTSKASQRYVVHQAFAQTMVNQKSTSVELIKAFRSFTCDIAY